MENIPNEIIFYGGIVIAAVAVLAMTAAFLVFTVKKSRLKEKLDNEYGKKEKK